MISGRKDNTKFLNKKNRKSIVYYTPNAYHTLAFLFSYWCGETINYKPFKSLLLFGFTLKLHYLCRQLKFSQFSQFLIPNS